MSTEICRFFSPYITLVIFFNFIWPDFTFNLIGHKLTSFVRKWCILITLCEFHVQCSAHLSVIFLTSSWQLYELIVFWTSGTSQDSKLSSSAVDDHMSWVDLGLPNIFSFKNSRNSGWICKSNTKYFCIS